MSTACPYGPEGAPFCFQRYTTGGGGRGREGLLQCQLGESCPLGYSKPGLEETGNGKSRPLELTISVCRESVTVISPEP